MPPKCTAIVLGLYSLAFHSRKFSSGLGLHRQHVWGFCPIPIRLTGTHLSFYCFCQAQLVFQRLGSKLNNAVLSFMLTRRANQIAALFGEDQEELLKWKSSLIHLTWLCYSALHSVQCLNCSDSSSQSFVSPPSPREFLQLSHFLGCEAGLTLTSYAKSLTCLPSQL